MWHYFELTVLLTNYCWPSEWLAIEYWHISRFEFHAIFISGFALTVNSLTPSSRCRVLGLASFLKSVRRVPGLSGRRKQIVRKGYDDGSEQGQSLSVFFVRTNNCLFVHCCCCGLVVHQIPKLVTYWTRGILTHKRKKRQFQNYITYIQEGIISNRTICAIVPQSFKNEHSVLPIRFRNKGVAIVQAANIATW